MRILIIGAGLSGTTLAHWCHRRGIDFHLIDKGENVSSFIAAGIINPMVFRRITLSWRGEECAHFAHNYYRELEALLGKSFYHPIRIRRFFASEQERGYWQKKHDLPGYSDFMSTISEEDMNFPSERNDFGTAIVKGCAYVDAKSFMNYQWEWFKAQGKLTIAPINYEDINPETGTYKNEQYDYIVCCEGKDAMNNPWFGKLPVQQTKGQLIVVDLPQLSQEESLNRKCFMLPIGGGKFRVGSTYEWETNNTECTEEAKLQLMDNIASLTNEPYTVVSQLAGVRPTTLDRRPIMGQHPDFKKLYISNGLGTKGYMLAPLLAKELLEHIVDEKPLDKEVDLRRCKV